MVVVLPALMYVALTLPVVQRGIRDKAQEELSGLLGAEVTVGELGIRPFNKVDVRRVSVVNDGDTVLTVDKIGASLNVYELIFSRKLAFNHAELIGPRVKLWRDSAGAPLNIQPILERLSGKDENKPQSRFDFRVNSVVLRRGALSYDVKSVAADSGRFDANHILVSDLNADINGRRISNDNISVDLRRLSFKEASGIRINSIQADVDVMPDKVRWADISIATPRSILILADGEVAIDGLDSLGRILDGEGIKAEIEEGSHVYIPELAPVCGLAENLPVTLDFHAGVVASSSKIEVGELYVSDDDGSFLAVAEEAVVADYRDAEKMFFSIGDLRINLGGSALTQLKRSGIVRAPRFNALQGLTLTASAEGSALGGRAQGKADVNGGILKFNADYSRASVASPIEVSAGLDMRNLDLASAIGNADLGPVNAAVEAQGTVSGSAVSGSAKLNVEDFSYKGHVYDSFVAEGVYHNGDIEVVAALEDEDVNFHAVADGSIAKGRRRLSADVDVRSIDFNALGLTDRFPGYTLRFSANADLAGERLDRCDGRVVITDAYFHHPHEKSLAINDIEVETNTINYPREISLRSEFINGNVEGDFDFSTVAETVKSIALNAFPSLQSPSRKVAALPSDMSDNKFVFSFKVNDTEKLSDFFRLPVSVIYPMTIEGKIDSESSTANVTVDAPYIRQNNKVIEGTMLMATANGADGDDRLFLTTSMPTKDGDLALMVSSLAVNDHVDLQLDWNIDRARAYNGAVLFGADLTRDDDNLLCADIALKQSKLVFNDSVWNINPARILIEGGKRIEIDDINVHRSNQFVKINGVASPLDTDSLKVDILNLSLDYVFETLNIDAVMLMGDASGEITASSLLSPSPHLETEGIRVKGIGYNGCRLGDALVKSHWDMENKAVVIDGTIYQPNDRVAKVEGEIFPLSSSLDIRLFANETPVGFMQKYMGAFASDITGKASGKARLYGTFHDIDMTGEIFAEDLKLKLNFTNTYFTATDSIHITPGKIELKDIAISDLEGNSGKLNGYVAHEFFRDPIFNFAITDCRNVLAYNESSKDNPDWYGKLYINGSARVEGKPGIVTIDVDASTAPNSTFTFVLSEMEEADEYTFLTFRDKSTLNQQVVEVKEDVTMRLVNHFKSLSSNSNAASETQYVIELRVGINPQAEINLIMDPVAGDKIRSHGSGNMRMVYRSKGNDLQMFGNYTLDDGDYNFTLQDIIIKKFIIDQGSRISFDGDPLAARLDVKAHYQLNANLSDLDESFLQDKDLDRTNVPVQAILFVKGDIQQPQISFDLAFPSLASDVYNKVKSIVSTEEMMNRQIIYLLALNRFYTPEYMSTTKGNELFSVASSTLTSQMSNILGRLSDNWTVSPTLRSDRGDFSDVEVDVALSSRLLNNRLLLNGNFGYRDKSLNSNQFIGDFEIEYLLNRAGTIRLKAYNYSNDETYYVRDAATTQGVGVMFKRDFDNMFSFLRRNARKAELKQNAAADTISVPADSIPADTIFN